MTASLNVPVTRTRKQFYPSRPPRPLLLAAPFSFVLLPWLFLPGG